jgi:hypothetical protein
MLGLSPHQNIMIAMPSHLLPTCLSLDTIKKRMLLFLSIQKNKKPTYGDAWPVMPCTVGGYRGSLLTASSMKESGTLRNER